MVNLTVLGVSVVLLGLAVGAAWAEPKQGRFEEKSAAFRRIVPEGAAIERLATGFRFTEGAVWVQSEGRLLFSDIPANKIYQWDAACARLFAAGQQAMPSVFRDPSGNSNGLTLDRQGCLIACEHGNRRVSRTEKDGRITVLADRYDGKRLNSPNDVIVKSDGSLYFTDPPYGLPKGTEGKELAFQGVYRLSPDGKALALLADDFDRPNGLAFSPDEKTLYVADSSSRKHIRAFDVQADGGIANGRLFADLKSDEPGAPDGMKVDVEGNIYATGPGGVWVFDPAGGLLGRIVPPEVPANCAWGDAARPPDGLADADWKSLYITARTSLYRVRLSISGVRVP